MKSPSHIGLDLAGRSLGLIQLSRKGESYKIVEAAQLRKRDSGEGLSAADAARAMEFVQNRGFSGLSVVAPVPLDVQLLSSFEIPPPDSGAPIDEITRSELARESKLADAEIESDWWVLPSTGKHGETTRAIAVGLSLDHGNSLVETLVDEGFEPIALDVRALANLRGCGHLLESCGKVSTLVEIGDYSTLSCVCLNDTIVYYRRVEEGLSSIINDVVREIGVDEAVAEALLRSLQSHGEEAEPRLRDLRTLVQARLGQLAQTVRAAIAYASHRYPHAEIGNILIFGAAADLLDVVPTFDQVIGIPIRRVTLGDVVRDTSHSLHGSSGLVSAAGLAMYGEAA